MADLNKMARDSAMLNGTTLTMKTLSMGSTAGMWSNCFRRGQSEPSPPIDVLQLDSGRHALPN